MEAKCVKAKKLSKIVNTWFLLDTAAFYSLGGWWEDYSCNFHGMGDGIQVINEDN